MKLNWKCRCSRCEGARDALSFLRFYLGGVLLVAGLVPAAGLFLWPGSSEPLLAALTGVGGLLALLLGAYAVTRP